MNSEELDRKLDEWIDRAAAENGRAAIRPGFETRVIADLKGRLEKRTRRFRLWVPVAITAAALLLISIHAVRIRYRDRGPAETASERLREIKPAPKQGMQKEPLPQKADLEAPAKAKAKIETRPKKTEAGSGGFLSSGLSEEERRLIKFVSEFPEAAAAGTPEKAEFKPIEIPEAEIPAFEIPEFEIVSFTIEPFNLSTPGNEEPL